MKKNLKEVNKKKNNKQNYEKEKEIRVNKPDRERRLKNLENNTRTKRGKPKFVWWKKTEICRYKKIIKKKN